MMKLFAWVYLAAAATRLAAAIDMSLYQPSGEVEAAFQPFLKELYAETEDPASTTSFTDFFTANGSLVVMSHAAVGAERITALKKILMPADGSKIWSHVPNATSVYADTDTSRVYEVQGVIQTTYKGGNCSQAYYSTRFTVAKGEEDREPRLTVRSGSLITYDDYLVDPFVSPTDIPCQGRADGTEVEGAQAAAPAGHEEL